jgi:Tfp pilus assembly protein PilO
MTLTKIDLITLSLAVLVPMGSYFGYFKYRTSYLRRLETESAALLQETADEREVHENLTRSRLALRKLDQQIGDFLKSITAQDEAHKAVGTIVSEAKNAGVTIEMIRPGDPVEGSTLHYLPLSISARSEFTKFYDFLRRLENDRTVITVNSMSIESPPHEDQCAVKLELRIYFVKSDQAANEESAT